jgi:hypothetical protein
MRRYTPLVALLMFLTFIDWAFTYGVVSLGGKEVNYLPAYLISNYGFLSLMIVKFITSLLISVYCVVYRKYVELVVANCVLGLICVWMVIQLFLSVLLAF